MELRAKFPQEEEEFFLREREEVSEPGKGGHGG